jgi:hypothetical protein
MTKAAPAWKWRVFKERNKGGMTMGEFEIKKATRVGVNPLIALFSESGCGKTYSALLLARGLVGSAGRITMIDTESGRGSLYADVIPGGYDVIELREPFTPERYIGAIDAAEKAGAQVVIVDSASHEWEGANGILDMAADIEKESGKAGLHCWRKPKFQHALFVARLIRSRIPLITCIRAKYKSRQTKENGKTVIVKDDFTSPMQAEDFIYESTVSAEIMPDHSCRVTKVNHPALRECFPAKGPITSRHGEALARWCAAPGSKSPTAAPATAPAASPSPAPLASATAKDKAIHAKAVRGLWAVKPRADMTAQEYEQWLWDEALIEDTENLAGLSVERMGEVQAKVKEHRNAVA